MRDFPTLFFLKKSFGKFIIITHINKKTLKYTEANVSTSMKIYKIRKALIKSLAVRRVYS